MNFDLMQSKCVEVSSLLKNFAHPQRLLILCYLSKGEKAVTDIYQAVGLSQSQTSQFLKRMHAEGLLRSRRDKNYSLYSIANPQVLKLIKSMQKIFCA
jgi:DNA-binding transcriptional ArsR family regulator